MSGSAETLPGSALGTPGLYESGAGSRRPRHAWSAVGLYSLGATLYCLPTACLPFEGEMSGVLGIVQKGEFPPPRQRDPAVDRSLEAVCLQAMALKPEDRYPSARALADDVERWIADEPVSARSEPVPARLARWARRHRTAVAAWASRWVQPWSCCLSLTSWLATPSANGLALSQVKEEQGHTVEALQRADANFHRARQAVEDYSPRSLRTFCWTSPACRPSPEAPAHSPGVPSGLSSRTCQ